MLTRSDQSCGKSLDSKELAYADRVRSSLLAKMQRTALSTLTQPFEGDRDALDETDRMHSYILCKRRKREVVCVCNIRGKSEQKTKSASRLLLARFLYTLQLLQLLVRVLSDLLSTFATHAVERKNLSVDCALQLGIKLAQVNGCIGLTGVIECNRVHLNNQTPAILHLRFGLSKCHWLSHALIFKRKDRPSHCSRQKVWRNMQES
ncbi:hypothetical protein BCV70DRAFT_26556 [Testicularia cyperi]|uniref:Uncharacterized protein n=1 Tax=Testicularia cyperi TaxID=1882483 RepID=A0A317XLK7_9BASI|nr:hypothetical protein BCV70DRAFT_26556 [Testicularia cyperi]